MATQKIITKHLKDCPEHLSLIASWIYNEWWTEKPQMSLEKMEDKLREAKTDCEIPLSLIAFVNNQPAGTVNLIEADNSEFPHLKPWLAALLVSPTYRNQGVGCLLIKKLLDCAKQLNLKELYLGTDIPNYYKPFGAEVFTTGSKNLKIMRIGLR